MKISLSLIILFITMAVPSQGQADQQLNKTDAMGRKQGHWIRRNPDQTIVYDGYFKDDHPVGEMKRYFEDQRLRSDLIYSNDGHEAEASIYHPNGFIASRGKYVNQLKEGKWQFFSEFVEGYLISEEYYTKNLKNGLSVKFYPDSTVAEKVIYVNDIKQGDWTEYYPSGKLSLRSKYVDGKINGKFEVWYDNGAIEYSGQYRNDAKEGPWIVYNKDGSIKYRLEYHAGVTTDKQMENDAAAFLDSLDLNKGKIADPEKTGVIK